MIRILHVVSRMVMGGMESYIMNMYRQIDRSQIQFDFLVHRTLRGVYDDEIEAMGGRIYRTSVLEDMNFLKYRKELRRFFDEHPEYRIVHGHLGSMAYWYLGEAERHGIPWRILHSHCPGHVPSLKGYATHLLFYLSPRHANIYMACSKEAGIYQFKNENFELIPNGIDVDKFRFSEETRLAARKQLGLEQSFVLGHVGRFFTEKNHVYMLQILNKLIQTMPDAKLMFLGAGGLMEDIQRQAEELGLSQHILFMGLQKDCVPYYQAMDLFIMPSLYEGLPLAALEAQCAGLPCIFSDTVSPQTKISADVQFVPIGEENIDQWIQAIGQVRSVPRDRAHAACDSNDYDVKTSANKMAERYKALWEKKQ